MGGPPGETHLGMGHKALVPGLGSWEDSGTVSRRKKPWRRKGQVQCQPQTLWYTPAEGPHGAGGWAGRWGMRKGASQRPGRGLQNPADDGRVRTIQGHQDARRVDNKTDTGFSYKVLTLMGTLSGESQAVGMHGKRQQANSNLSKVRW